MFEEEKKEKQDTFKPIPLRIRPPEPNHKDTQEKKNEDKKNTVIIIDL